MCLPQNDASPCLYVIPLRSFLLSLRTRPCTHASPFLPPILSLSANLFPIHTSLHMNSLLSPHSIIHPCLLPLAPSLHPSFSLLPATQPSSPHSACPLPAVAPEQGGRCGRGKVCMVSGWSGDAPTLGEWKEGCHCRRDAS